MVFSLNHGQSYKTIKEFLDFLADQNIRTFTLAYCPFKEIPDSFIGHTRINIFTRRDLNWLYTPRSSMVKKFIVKDFDILFDLSTSHEFPTKYVNNVSRAKFKIGRESKNGKDHDMIFRIEENKELHYFIDQLKHYVSQINKER